MAGDKVRGYTGGRFGLSLDGDATSWVHSAEGGHATADVVVEKQNTGFIAHKHLAGVKYEDISVVCGTGMSKNFYSWLDTSIQGKALASGRKDGSIVSADYDFNVMQQLNFHQAVISELGFPALDAAGKDPCKMTVKFTPEYTRWQKGNGKLPSGSSDASKQKKWLPANFRIKIDGLDDAMKKVNKVEALTVKQKVARDESGETRDAYIMPANLEFPNLVLTMSDSHADAVYAWHDDFVIKGNCFQDKEKGGTIEYLTTDLKEVLFTLTFMNLGIFKITPDKGEAHAEGVKRIKVEMYCEQIKFAYGNSTWY